jgi:phosphatidate cytidylyltransferase
MAPSETAKRLLVAVVGIPVAGLAVYLGGPWLAALVLAASVLTARELYRMAARKPSRPLAGLGMSIAAGLVLVAAASPGSGPGAGFALVIVVGLLVLLTVVIWTHGVEGEPLLSVSTSLAGAVYAGGLLSYGIFLRHLPGTSGPLHGAALVFAPLLLTWSSDTFAYFAGRAWGTRKLIPRVSPGKTVQGAVGAVVGTVVVAVAYSRLLAGFPTYTLGWLEAAVFGLLISVAAQVGDLAESLLKRDTGVKDSGSLLPGHGGVLDRVDSLLFTLPIAYIFFSYVAGRW